MTHAKNKVKWCLKKAQQELTEGNKHRGLIQAQPNPVKAKDHILSHK
jgi:hypothetical protein